MDRKVVELRSPNRTITQVGAMTLLYPTNTFQIRFSSETTQETQEKDTEITHKAANIDHGDLLHVNMKSKKTSIPMQHQQQQQEEQQPVATAATIKCGCNTARCKCRKNNIECSSSCKIRGSRLAKLEKVRHFFHQLCTVWKEHRVAIWKDVICKIVAEKENKSETLTMEQAGEIITAKSKQGVKCYMGLKSLL